MAAEAITIAPTSYTFSRPLRNLALTICLTALALTVAGYLAGERGFEILIVGMGWPHVLLGFVFFLGRVVKGVPGARRSLLVLLPATLGLWLLHYSFDITFGIYVYFIFHAFRDEVFIFFQTSQTPPRTNVYTLRGLAPLILLVLLVGQPKDYRQDLRRVELTGNSIVSGWTLFQFDPIKNSKDRDFYFYVQSPQSHGRIASQALLDPADGGRSYLVNEIGKNDGRGLRFTAQYDSEPLDPIGDATVGERAGVGDHRLGQTFRATRAYLSGIWLRTEPSSTDAVPPSVFLHIASPPLLPLESPLSWVRFAALIAILGAFVLFSIAPAFRRERNTWLFIALLAAGMILFQQVFRPLGRDGYTIPMIFQVVVVFHYFSWYVFSYGKFGALKRMGSVALGGSGAFERQLNRLRDPVFFTAAVVVLNALSFAGALWVYSGGAPAVLGYAFIYPYFLYFLVLHVTFSFSPFAKTRSGS